MKVTIAAFLDRYPFLRALIFPGAPPDIELDDLRRRRFFELFVVLGNFVLLGFGINHLLAGNSLQAAFDFGVWLMLLAAVILLRRIRNAAWVFRCVVLSIGGLFFWDAVYGGPDGSFIFWFLLLPVFSCFMLGRIEGTIWGISAGLLLTLFLHQAFPGIKAYPYPHTVTFRFLMVYYIFALGAVVFEHSRYVIENIHIEQHAQLQKKKRKLELTRQALKKAIRRLNQNRVRLNHAQAMAHVGGWDYDLGNGRVELSNEARRIYGLEPGEAVPIESASRLVPDAGTFLKGFDNLLHFGRPFDTEFTIRRFSDRQEIILHAKAELIRDENGNPAKIFGIIQDITERKKSEEERQELELQLQQAQKMEAIGTLAGGVAHDLNNVLAGILSYPELLLMQMPQDHPLREPINIIKKSGEKAAALVQDLLTLARRNVTIREVINLNTIILDYLGSPEFKRLRAYHPDVRIKTGLDPSLVNIMGSPVQLAKTVMNLVSNAAEAMPDGGELTIETHNRPACPVMQTGGGNEAGDCVHLRVQDQGTGIDPGDEKRIFEPFFTKKAMGRSGTGLGMAVVWGTVQDHQGRIDIKSTPGAGTVFTLHFPGTHAIEPKHGEVDGREDFPKGAGETILVVDDMEEQRLIASSMLSALGYRTMEAENGEAAVECIRETTADLVLLDMLMEPGISGLETYRRIISLRPSQPVVIVSGYSRTGQVERAIALGADGYLKKPYTMGEIAAAVRSVLRRSKIDPADRRRDTDD